MGNTSSGQSQTTTTQQLTPQQQQLMEQATGNYLQFGASNPTLPTGNQAVSPFTAAQTAGQGAVLGATGIPGTSNPGGGPTMADTVNTAAGTNQYLSSGAFLDPGSNPYVQNAVKAATDPIFQDLSQRTIPGQQATAASGSGVNYGGSREGVAEGLDTQGAYRAAGQTGANIMNTALGQGLTATGNAVAQAPATAGSLAIPGATSSAVGETQQNQAQAYLDAANQAQWFQEMLPMLKGQVLGGAAGSLPGGGSTSTGQTQYEPSAMSNIIGMTAAIGSLLGGLRGKPA